MVAVVAPPLTLSYSRTYCCFCCIIMHPRIVTAAIAIKLGYVVAVVATVAVVIIVPYRGTVAVVIIVPYRGIDSIRFDSIHSCFTDPSFVAVIK